MERQEKENDSAPESLRELMRAVGWEEDDVREDPWSAAYEALWQSAGGEDLWSAAFNAVSDRETAAKESVAACGTTCEIVS